jgi:hypothetical protein
MREPCEDSGRPLPEAGTLRIAIRSPASRSRGCGVRREKGVYSESRLPYVLPVLAHTTRALQLLFQTVAEVDTLEELARVGTIAVELYEGDDAVLRELMQAIEARATAIRDQLRLFPAPPVEPPPTAALEPAPPDLLKEWCTRVLTMGPDELDAIETLTHKHWERSSLRELRGAIENRRRQLGA